MGDARVAVTGSRGLLGATLMRVLPDAVALTSDIRDSEALADEFSKIKGVTHIIHTAAKTDVGACERDPSDAYAVNEGGTKHIVDIARPHNLRMLFVSTVSVFSGNEGNYRETDTPESGNVHNTTKAAGETHVLAYERGTVLRLNLVGVHPQGSRGKNFMEWLINSVQSNKDIHAFTDVMINPLSNWTVVDYIQMIIDQKLDERILHIGSGDVRSKADIVQMVASRFPEYSGTITPASVDSIKDGVPRPKQMWLNCDYTKGVLGISMPSIESEIDKIVSSLP